MKVIFLGIILLSAPSWASLTVSDPENLQVEETFPTSGSHIKTQGSSGAKSPDLGTFDPTSNIKIQGSSSSPSSDLGTFDVKEDSKKPKEKPFKTGPYDSKGNYRIDLKRD